MMHCLAHAFSVNEYTGSDMLDTAADGVEAAAAQATYSKKTTPPAPCGRYGATSVIYNEQLWLFGGTDGGVSKKDMGKSKPGKRLSPDLASYGFVALCDYFSL